MVIYCLLDHAERGWLMDKLYAQIDTLMRCDTGGRGFCSNSPVSPMHRLATALNAAGCVLIITGFPVKTKEGNICCETDGPLGAANIAHALCEVGKTVYVATDVPCYPQLAAACALRAPNAHVLLLNGNANNVFDLGIDTVISIERPGRSLNGCYRAASGRSIDEFVFADTDAIFRSLHDRGALTIAIGDGGNELGMGSLYDVTSRLVSHGKDIAAVQAADITLTSGVSNWWGWGIAAVISSYFGKNILPTEADERAMLRAALDAGAVDGITALSEESIDAISIDEHISRLLLVHIAVNTYLDKYTNRVIID